MFNNLLESKPKKEKRGGGTVTSVIVHSILVGLAIYATANAAIRNEKPKQEKIDFVETPKDEPPPPKEEPPPPPPPDVVVAPPPPKGFQVLTAPVEIPDVIPDIDLSKKVTDEADFSGKGVAGGVAKGKEGGAVVQSDQPYFEFQVEKPVVPAPGSISPRYPDMLRQAGVEGLPQAALHLVAHNRRADCLRHREPQPGPVAVLAREPVEDQEARRDGAPMAIDRVEVARAREAVAALHARVQRSQAERRLRPLARRRLRIARPARVDIRARKPCRRFRLRTFGW